MTREPTPQILNAPPLSGALLWPVSPEIHLLLWIYALSVSLPSCQSTELTFDQAHKAPRKWCILDLDWGASGGGGRMASFEGKRLLG